MLFYRSLLQVILEHKLPHIDPMAFQVGRQRKPIASFLDYARWALGKLQLNIEVRFLLFQNKFPKKLSCPFVHWSVCFGRLLMKK